MDAITPSLKVALARHGTGTVHSVLEAIGRAHALRIECASHGFFLKAFVDKSSSSSSVVEKQKEALSSEPKTKICRENLLSMRPRNLREQKWSTHVKTSSDGDVGHSSQLSCISSNLASQGNSTTSSEPYGVSSLLLPRQNDSNGFAATVESVAQPPPLVEIGLTTQSTFSQVEPIAIEVNIKGDWRALPRETWQSLHSKFADPNACRHADGVATNEELEVVVAGVSLAIAEAEKLLEELPLERTTTPRQTLLTLKQCWARFLSDPPEERRICEGKDLMQTAMRLWQQIKNCSSSLRKELNDVALYSK